MKTSRLIAGISIILLFIMGCAQARREQAKDQKIGIYDSRSIAVAYAGSEPHEAKLKQIRDEVKAAKAKGDKRKVQKLERTVREGQERMHYQGFGTTPVDDILAVREPEVREMMQDKGLSAIVSKWDKKELEKHKNAQRVDVTQDLVDLFHPNARQRKSAEEIQKVKPYSKDKLRLMMMSEGGH